MKPVSLLIIAVLGLSFSDTNFTSLNSGILYKNDSLIIKHINDGKADEWPADKFSVENEFTIRYSVDNDATNLYLALIIKSEQEQIKMMRMGMNIYFDLKGKKRDNMGIEFPLKSELNNSVQLSGNSGQQTNSTREKFDLQAAKMRYGYNLLGLKLFGFTNTEPLKQVLDQEGSVQIAYTWDSTNIMQIEYLVPLNLLGEPSSLNQKEISIGFHVNGITMPTAGTGNFAATSGGGGGRGGGGNRQAGAGGGQSGSNFNPATMEKMMQDQKFWTKYSISIPAPIKGF